MAIVNCLLFSLLVFSYNSEVIRAQNSGSYGNYGSTGVASLSEGVYYILREITNALLNSTETLQVCLVKLGRITSESLGNVAQYAADTIVVTPSNIIELFSGFVPEFLGGKVLRYTNSKVKDCFSNNTTPELVKYLVQVSLGCVQNDFIGKPVTDLTEIANKINEALANLPDQLKEIEEAADVGNMVKKILQFGIETGKFVLNIVMTATGLVSTLGTGIPEAGICIADKIILEKTLRSTVLRDAKKIGECIGK